MCIATELKPVEAEREALPRLDPWHGRCDLQFHATNGSTKHQGGCTAPFKLLRSERGDDGRCELPVLHAAGGLVGGDQLSLDFKLEANSRGLITSVAAQKVYGSIGRSRLQPEGCFAHQHVHCALASGSDLEWLPQELVLYADALFEQQLTVTLPQDASFLSAEIVRLGRTAAGETLQQGQWRSSLTIQRLAGNSSTWELADRVEPGGASLDSPHGLGGAPVFGTLVWAAPMAMGAETTTSLLEDMPDLPPGRPGEITLEHIRNAKDALANASDALDNHRWFGETVTRERASEADDFFDSQLSLTGPCVRLSGRTRVAWTEREQHLDVFINGETFEVPSSAIHNLMALCRQEHLVLAHLADADETLLTALVAMGAIEDCDNDGR